MECGNTFFASQTTGDMETPIGREANMVSVSRWKCITPKEIEEETNHIASELYHDRTDLTPILACLTLPVTYICYPYPLTQNVYKHWISILLSLLTHMHLICWIWQGSGQGLSGVKQEAHAIFWTFGCWSASWPKYIRNSLDFEQWDK